MAHEHHGQLARMLGNKAELRYGRFREKKAAELFFGFFAPAPSVPAVLERFDLQLLGRLANVAQGQGAGAFLAVLIAPFAQEIKSDAEFLDWPDHRPTSVGHQTDGIDLN